MSLATTPVVVAVVNAADAGLKGLEKQAEMPAPRRPTWQRWLLPVLGTILVLAGIVLFWLPFTNLLIVVGLPLMFCFSRRWENAARRRMRRLVTAMRRWLPRRGRRRATPRLKSSR